jgi:hypothetical protein
MPGTTVSLVRRLTATISPVIGSLVLFGAWVIQQTAVETARTEARRLADAQNSYVTYQSNNALFNALIAAAAPETTRVLAIRGFQVNNYELGLTAMDNALSTSEHAGIPAAVFMIGGQGADVERRMQVTQVRLESLQARIRTKQDALDGTQRVVERRFLALYVLGTVLVLVGAILKAVNDIATPLATTEGSPNGLEDIAPFG